MKNNENVTNNIENIQFISAVLLTDIAIGMLGGLALRSINQLTTAKEKMKDPVRTQEQCESSVYGCTYQTNVTLCDGQNTMFNLDDDVCEIVPFYWEPNIPMR